MATEESQPEGRQLEFGQVRGSLSWAQRDAEEIEEVDVDKFDGILRRELPDFEIRAINEEERSFEVVASTDTIDAHGDVVKQKFNLKRYKKNPVTLFLHNRFGLFDGSRPEDFLPIGHAKNVKVEDGNLVAKIVFVKGTPEEEPFVDKVWRRIVQRAMRAVSIGFRPGKVTERQDEHGHYYFELSDNELFEISVVPIPSNPDAVGKQAALEHKYLSRLAAKQKPQTENEEMADNDRLEKALKENAEAETKVKSLEEQVAAKDKALEAETEKTKSLEEKLEAQKTRSDELAEKLEESDKELKSFREEAEKRDKAAAEKDVDEALKAKISPAKHDEKREKWLKIRMRSADEFGELIEDIPDLPHLKTIVSDNPTTKADEAKSLVDECKSA